MALAFELRLALDGVYISVDFNCRHPETYGSLCSKQVVGVVDEMQVR